MPAYKNQFAAPDHLEETIQDENGNTVGTVRIKPSSILWKPKNERKFFAVSLEDFANWICDSKTNASRTKS